jgi:hypothetical protein
MLSLVQINHFLENSFLKPLQIFTYQQGNANKNTWGDGSMARRSGQ